MNLEDLEGRQRQTKARSMNKIWPGKARIAVFLALALGLFGFVLVVRISQPIAISAEGGGGLRYPSPNFAKVDQSEIVSANEKACDLSLGRPTNSSISISVYLPCPEIEAAKAAAAVHRTHEERMQEENSVLPVSLLGDFSREEVAQSQNCKTHEVYALYRKQGSFSYWKSGGPAVQITEGAVPVSLKLSDLQPSTQYSYLVCYKTEEDLPWVESERHCHGPYSFSTAKARGTSFTFTIESDSEIQGDYDSEAMVSQSMTAAAAWRPDFHFHVGDFLQNDQWQYRDASYEDRLAVQLDKRRLYAPHLARVPLFLVRGNHEGEQGYDMYGEGPAARAAGRDMPTTSARARKAVFDQPEPDHFYTGNDEDYPFIGKKNNWYAFEWGDALFVALDILGHTTECDFPRASQNLGEKKQVCNPGEWQYTLGQAQYDWLCKTLKGSDATHKFVFIHHLTKLRGGASSIPFFEWGGHARDKHAPGEVGPWEFDAMRPGWPKPVHEVLVENGVDVVFHGHDHVWAFEPREGEGIVYQEVPKPNQLHDGAASAGNCVDGHYENCLPSSGYVKVDVTPGAFRVEYRGEAVDPATGRRDEGRSGQVRCGYTATAGPFGLGGPHRVVADAGCYAAARRAPGGEEEEAGR